MSSDETEESVTGLFILDVAMQEWFCLWACSQFFASSTSCNNSLCSRSSNNMRVAVVLTVIVVAAAGVE